MDRPTVLLAHDNTIYGDDNAYEIVTPSATYYYHKAGAGFAGLLDRDGNDWISHSRRKGSAGQYRGIPNVGPAGFHPGYNQCRSWVEPDGGTKLTIHSERLDGSWACRWDIFATHADFTIERTDGSAYYFLYEGTPNGRFDPCTNFLVRPDFPAPHPLSSATGDEPIARTEGEPYEWIAFGDTSSQRVLFLVHHASDNCGDRFWPMENNMTVFGFGRTGGNDMNLHGAPRRFTIGFCDSPRVDAVRQAVGAAARG